MTNRAKDREHWIKGLHFPPLWPYIAPPYHASAFTPHVSALGPCDEGSKSWELELKIDRKSLLTAIVDLRSCSELDRLGAQFEFTVAA